ncbi:MAG TPA: Ig-like domain-containing protein [Candidatus Dormibacteraeota bacterium]
MSENGLPGPVRMGRLLLLVVASGLAVAVAGWALAPLPALAAVAAPVRLTHRVPATVSAGVPIAVSATITSNGAPLAKRLVRFYVDGKEDAAALSAASGVASTTIRDQVPAGSHTVRAAFAGSAGYAPASATQPLLVKTSTLTVHVVPAVPGTVTLSIDGGTPLTEDREGYITTNLSLGGRRTLTIAVHDPNPTVKATFVAWSNHDTSPTRVLRIEHSVYTQVAIQVSYLTQLRFQDATGHPLSSHRVTRLSVDGPDGAVLPVIGSKVWLTTPVPHSTSTGALAVGPEFYSLRTASYEGVDVAKRGEDRVVPGVLPVWTMRLDVYPLTLYGRDMLFGGVVSGPALLTGPAGISRHLTIQERSGSTLVVPGGLYRVRYSGLGFAPTVRVRVSAAQVVPVKVFTALDAVVVVFLLLIVILALLAVSRWRSQLLARLPVWREMLRKRLGSSS